MTEGPAGSRSRSTVTASVTLGHALRYAKGSARSLLHQALGHYPEAMAEGSYCLGRRQRRWRLRYAPLPWRDHRPRRGCRHTDPAQWSRLERRLSRCHRAKRDPAGHPSLRPDALEDMVRLSRPKSGRGPDELLEALRREDHATRPGPPNRRNPDPYHHHEPLLAPRAGRSRSRSLKKGTKGCSLTRS